MDCPTCGWNMRQRHEWEMSEYLLREWECKSGCPTTVRMKAPLEWMKTRRSKPL